MALKDEIQNMKTIEQGVANNKVVNFAYTNKAYTDNDVNGVDVYDFNNDNNIPTNNPDVIKVNSTVITKGYRAQASSITRMLINHIFGRVSYNLNKTADLFTSLLDKLGNAIGEPNGIATLDVDGRIPYSQLPESAVEYKGEWNAETNTPTLVDGTGTTGDMYYVSTDGTQNLGSGDITFLAGDRIIYNGTVWQRFSGGSVKKVNNIRPDDTGNVQLSFSNLDGTVANSQITNNAVTTAKIANSNVTTAKIADNAVTTAKIADSNVTTAKIANNAVTNEKFGDVLPLSKGGTGETTAKGGFTALANSLTDSENPADEERIIFKYADILNYGTYTFSRFWDYIKAKISSVLGLTASQYNGKAKEINVYDLTDGTDLDYVRNPGQYKIDSGTVTNAPYGITNGFNLEVFYVKSNYVCQRLTRYVTTGVTSIYVRTLIWAADNIWSEWRRIAYTDSTIATATTATTANTFTYVVDSDQKLLDWANNVARNDYSSVLIKKGTWSSLKGVNLTDCGTKVVVGEVGSLLDFTSYKGLFYDEVPTSSEYYMLNVSINIIYSGSASSSSFNFCTNLTNCTSSITNQDNSQCIGFNSCTNLTNCTGTSNSNIKASYGFNSCTNLTNCTGIGNSNSRGGYGFGSCTNLTNCTGIGNSNEGYGGYGFASCTNLTNCTGTGNSIRISGNSISSSGYGFSNCQGVSRCKAGGNCSTSVFVTSYASQSANNTYVCADTPEGGFNNITNPSS